MFKEKDRVAVIETDGKTREWVWGGERIYTIKTTTPYITLWDTASVYCDKEGVVILTRNPGFKCGDKLEFRFSHATDLYQYLQKYLADEDEGALKLGIEGLKYNGLVGGENALAKDIVGVLEAENSKATIQSLVTSYYGTVKH